MPAVDKSRRMTFMVKLLLCHFVLSSRAAMVPEQNFLVAVDSTIYTAKVFTILCLDGHTIFCEISRQIHSIGDTPLVLYMMATYDRFI